MDRNVYQNELNAVGFTEEGRAALTDALLEVRPVRRGRPWKGLAAVLAAVLLIGSAVATAGPVWNLFFGDLNEDQQAVIETLSQKLPAATSNGAAMTPLMAFGDQDFYYLLLEITPPESVTLPNYSADEGFYQFMDGDGVDIRITGADGEDLPVSCEYDWLARGGGNAPLTAVIRLWNQDGVDFSDGTEKTLTIPGLWVQSPDKEYTPVLTGSWSFAIGTYTGGIQGRTLEVSGITTPAQYCDGLTLESMRISPLGMRWRYHWSGLTDEKVTPGAEISVLLDDGSKIFLDNTMGSWNPDECWEEIYGPFSAPVDLDHAVSVHWGEAEIPLK